MLGTFKLNAIIRKTHFTKHEGYGVTEILALMMMLPLLLLNSVNSLYHSQFQQLTQMKKDAIYRLKNHPMMPWRAIVYGVAKRFQVPHPPPATDVAGTTAFIIDDATDARVGRRIENVSYTFDHVVGKTL